MKIKLGRYREFTVFIKLFIFHQSLEFYSDLPSLAYFEDNCCLLPPFPHVMNLYKSPTLTTLCL